MGCSFQPFQQHGIFGLKHTNQQTKTVIKIFLVLLSNLTLKCGFFGDNATHAFMNTGSGEVNPNLGQTLNNEVPFPLLP